jgi:hypothetical protein
VGTGLAHDEGGSRGGGGPGRFQATRAGGGGSEPAAAWRRWARSGDTRGRGAEMGKGSGATHDTQWRFAII